MVPPEADTMDGELVDEDDDDGDERTSMLRQDYKRARDSFRGSSVGNQEERRTWDGERDQTDGGRGKGKEVLRDTEGRPMPATEWAPSPGAMSRE